MISSTEQSGTDTERTVVDSQGHHNNIPITTTPTPTSVVHSSLEISTPTEARHIPLDGVASPGTISGSSSIDVVKVESTLPGKEEMLIKSQDPAFSSSCNSPSLPTAVVKESPRTEEIAETLFSVPSSLVVPDGKKRPISCLEENALNQGTTKKARCMHSSFETHLIKKEELTTEVSALLDHPSHGIKHNDGRLSGLGGLRDDEPEPLIESTTSVLLSTKTAPGHDDPPGIFDDADEDDSFDLAAIKKLPPRAAPSSRSLRPDLVAAILGSAPKQFLAPAPVAAPPLDKPGHKKKKLAAKKVLRARKEIEGASKLLKGKIDLMKVLPERDCRFLAQNLWIFTLDQLEAVLNATDGKELDVCSELIAILKDSVLLNEGDKDHQDLFQVSSNEHALRSDFYDKCPVDRINVDDDAVDSIPGRQSFDGHNNETNDSAKGLCMKTEGSKSTNSEDQVSKKVSDTNGAEAERLDIGEDPIVASKMSVDELMQSWRKKIQDFDQLCETDETSRFSLDGPLSCLIPKSTQNFLKSAGIVSAREFLSLKKTESGLVVDIYVSWRKKCGMEEIPCVTIAKHLLAIGTRLEVAIESSAISKEVREWVGGHTIVLSGQGKDFLFDHCKLYNADEFIERRTKELADRLRDWRDSKGLPPLKGTGKVAMISAWKTLVKEAKELESHDGRVLKTEDLMAELEEDISAAIVPKNTVPKPVDASVEKKRRAKKSDIVTPLSEQVVLPPMNSGSPKGQTVLESQGLLSDILKKEIVVMLASNGITSAKELLYAGKQADSRLISAVMRMRKDFSGDSSTSDNAEGCIRLVREWCQQVEQRQGVASPDKHASPEWQTTLDRSYTEKKFPDPWDALSQASKDFLTSIDIKDAESFLAAKTKNLAESFTIYREKNGMAPLKGLGSVASISGWKAIVRKAAKDAGQDRLVTLNAGRNAGIKLNRRAKEETKESQPQSLQQGYQEVSISKVRPSETSDRGGIHGISKNKFWVANGSNAFCFDLTLRRFSNDNSKLSSYLTYLGNKRMEPSESSFPKFLDPRKDDEDVMTLTLMEDAGKTYWKETPENMAFSSPKMGLFDLSTHGISPRPHSGDLALLKATLMSFIFQKNHKPSYDSSIPYNVFERWEDGKKKYYFFIEGPIEVGQTVELLFLPPTPGVMLEGEWYEESRIWLAKEIDALSMKDLRSLLDFLHEEIGGSVYRSTLREFDTNLLGDEKVEFDLSAVSETIIARRRMHWSALRINAALQKGEAAIVPGIALIPLWSYDLVCRLRRHPAWAESLCRLLRTECSNEVMTEFKSTTTGNFWKTQEMWCSMAKELFQETVRLFAHFSAELDGFCSEQQLIDDISSMVSRAVSNLRQAMEQTPDKHSLAQLLMRVKDETLPPSNMFPSTLCLQATLTQGYLDSMALCDEPPFECPSKDELLFVATSGVKNITTHFQTLEDVHATNSKIDIFWYIRTQVMAVVENAAICGVANIALGGPSKIRDVCTLIRDSAKKALGSSDIAPFNFEICTTEKIHRSIAVPNILLGMTVPPKCQPNSGPIFLVTVWPVLKQAKWRIEGGAAPSSIIYFSPERKKDKRTRHVKQEAAIQRRKLARRTTQLGLGYVPKQVKRMFINCAAIDENIDEAPTVSEALHAFTQSLASIRGLDVISRTTKAVDYLAMLFEIVAPATIYETEARDVDLSNGTKWNESLTCGYLMRFLLVLPKMLNHLDLSIQQVESTTGVVSDLIAFLVENRKKWFGTSLQLPREEYETNYEFPKFILPHLEEAKAKLNEKRTKSETVPMSLKEVVLPSDRHELTDFVTTVLDQLIICRASTDDLRRKGRRAFLSLGCPGLMCRHCLGQYGEGKYFYSNMQSLSTAPTSIDKHIARCPKIHNEVKEKMIADKAKHSEQKASTPSGAQSAFFSRLWDRLQLSRGSIGTDADLYVTLHTTPTDMELDPDQHQNSAHSGSGVEFRNHVEIMEYIQTAAMWNSNADLLSAVEKYYSCLSFGGGIYNTTGMPPHYSSEWVLAKFGKASRLCESSVLER